MTTSHTVPADRLRLLLEIASSHEGLVTARTYDHSDGALAHPGDPWGAILCDAWRLDPDLAVLAGVAFVQGLRAESERLDRTPPTWTQIADSLPLALNDARYPDVDTKALVARLRSEVPNYFGEPI